MTDYPTRERGGGDCDKPYRFGRHPTVYLHARQFVKLLILRGRLQAKRTQLHPEESTQ